MNDHHSVATHAHVATARINQMQLLVFLLAHVCHAQIVGVEKFDDSTFQ